MATRKEIDAAFQELRSEWNEAEEAIKLAEQVNREIVNPAIYELRYSGRKIIEAFDVVDTDPADALKKLQDGHFDCCRARHDAIDATTSKISSKMDEALEYLGPDILLTHFPSFANLVRRLADVRNKIAASRKDRNNRSSIYAVLQQDDLSAIVGMYDDFLASEDLIRQSAVRARRTAAANKIFGLVGVVSFAFAVAIWFFSKS